MASSSSQGWLTGWQSDVEEVKVVHKAGSLADSLAAASAQRMRLDHQMIEAQPTRIELESGLPPLAPLKSQQPEQELSDLPVDLLLVKARDRSRVTTHRSYKII